MLSAMMDDTSDKLYGTLFDTSNREKEKQGTNKLTEPKYSVFPHINSNNHAYQFPL